MVSRLRLYVSDVPENSRKWHQTTGGSICMARDLDGSMWINQRMGFFAGLAEIAGLMIRAHLSIEFPFYKVGYEKKT